MSFAKYTVPALALAGAAFAQSSSCSVSGTTTIRNAADATQVAACPTFSGSVALATDLAEPVSLDGVLSEIDGSLICDSAPNVPSLSASQLQEITEDFILNNSTGLTDVTFPSLNTIGGRMSWVGVTNLPGLTFGSGVQRINVVDIRDTTIQDLSKINLKSAQSITIAQNLRLTTLSWQLTSVDKDLTLGGNGGDLGLNATFGNLASAGSISATNVTSLVMNSLKNVTQVIQITDSDLESLRLPNLTTTGGINLNNTQLTNISFPQLTTLSGALTLADNPDLGGTITFPALTLITSTITVAGIFDEILFPKMNKVKGVVDIRSTGALTETCNDIRDWTRQNIITVKPICDPMSGASNTTGGGNPTGSSGGTTPSEAAAAHVTIPAVITLGSVLAAAFGML